MGKKVKSIAILLCLLLLFAGCSRKETAKNDPVDVGVQAVIALMEGNVDAFCDLLVPNMLSNAGTAVEYEYRAAISEISEWIINDCEVYLSSTNLYTADKDDDDGFLSWQEYFAADNASYGDFAGSFFYDYAWETLSYFGYSGNVKEIAVCEIYMKEGREPDPLPVVLGKVNGRWYVITLLEY